MNQPHAMRGNSTVPSTVSHPRILVIGIRCRFTETFLQRLLCRGTQLIGVLVPGPPALAAPVRVTEPSMPLPMAGQPSRHSVFGRQPLFQIGAPAAPQTIDLVASLQPDVIVVACFPRRLPMALGHHAALGMLNVHPSLLPENRGPDPLFWAFRRGDGRFGVTVHRLSPRFDAGEIVMQRAFIGWHGVSESDVEHTLARHGADLALMSIKALVANAPGRPQDELGATYEGWPAEADYYLDTARPAHAAFNFVKGIKDRGVPVRVSVDGHDVLVRDALAFSHDDRLRTTAHGVVPIRCNPGTLLASVTAPR